MTVPSPSSSWWRAAVAAIPCFNNQAPDQLNVDTLTRRIVVMVIGGTAVLTTTVYQTLLLSSLLVQNTPGTPLSPHSLVQQIANNQLKIMFPRPNTLIEQHLRRGSAQQDYARFASALRRRPPLYC